MVSCSSHVAVITVRPVDDKVDERRGHTVDFTAFSITQSHAADDYWTYTTPYMMIPQSPNSVTSSNSDTEQGYCEDPDFTCAAGAAAGGRGNGGGQRHGAENAHGDGCCVVRRRPAGQGRRR
eukprot:COSAG04_NODE_1706_length_5869_cov_15.541421_5_plen_121_part_01